MVNSPIAEEYLRNSTVTSPYLSLTAEPTDTTGGTAAAAAGPAKGSGKGKISARAVGATELTFAQRVNIALADAGFTVEKTPRDTQEAVDAIS
eukprot:2205252-Amphidinium_carterae.1